MTNINQDIPSDEQAPQYEHLGEVLDKKELRKELLELAKEAGEGDETTVDIENESQAQILEALLKDAEFRQSLEKHAIIERNEAKSITFAPKPSHVRPGPPSSWHFRPQNQFGHFGDQPFLQSLSLDGQPSENSAVQTRNLPPVGASIWITHVAKFGSSKDCFQECEVSVRVNIIRVRDRDDKMNLAISAIKVSRTNKSDASDPNSWYELKIWKLSINGKELERNNVPAVPNKIWKEAIEKSRNGNVSLGGGFPAAFNVELGGELGVTRMCEIQGRDWEMKTTLRKEGERDGAQISWFKNASRMERRVYLVNADGADDLVDIDSKKVQVATFFCPEGQVRLQVKLKLTFEKKGWWTSSKERENAELICIPELGNNDTRRRLSTTDANGEPMN